MIAIKHLFPALLLLGTSIFWSSCKKSDEDTKPDATAPTGLTTQPATGITSMEAMITGQIGANGGSDLLSRGVVYSEINPLPTTSDRVELATGFAVGALSVQLSGLLPSTRYFARTFAGNAIGVSYGQTISFTTLAPPNSPVVSSNAAVSEITSVGAKFGGSVDSDGGSTILARGVCWNTTGSPTVELSSKTTDGAGLGTFSSTLSGLTAGTTYTVRAYATNAAGTSYGNEVSFTTAQATVSITFRVNMSNETVSPQGVHIAGTFQNPAWQPGANSMVNVGGGIWTYTTAVPINTTILYKFINGNAWGNNEILGDPCGTTPDGNRTLIVGTTDQTVTFCYNRCDANCIPATVNDVDGNTYNVVIIGTQAWLKENLRVTKYQNGDPIPTGLSNSQWQSVSSGACAIYGNNSGNDATYGKLYNWYALADPRGLCPAGWHVPSDAEWTTLEDFLGGSPVAGGKMKAVSSLWLSPNTGATNESGFSGLPGGNRRGSGNYADIGYYGSWWSSSQYSTWFAWRRLLDYNGGNSNRSNLDKQIGFSVRCLMD